MASGSKTPTVRVTTPNGIVEGFVRGGVRRFRSIPYARPPIGLLRLRAPQPALPWEGVRDCTEFGAAAPSGAAIGCWGRDASNGPVKTV
ncbi:carboxylesterase [Mycobacteroides abscessus subsp. abscessus]|nr:carboxylesterase family protein [Mycobacteroides abscessus MAB_030201_1075]SHZ53087.1 Probable carboxylesterase LipT [Mycobacteroides abscessus subsp. abscessus]SHZ62598.1 Probable carboxylesterase LipT [Mycobacteroides abscessus subsp. abscessus]SIA13804.1 Probable carboxylesterase LipT [Mycobacteroides abscessus subsp. abscessus]SIF04637.1 carboxylesterase [Mycobacteroides abscessus subsp. abscessus]